MFEGRTLLPTYVHGAYAYFSTSHSNQCANAKPSQGLQQVDMQVEHIGEACPYVLQSTPEVLSVGRRCEEFGYGLYREPFSEKPYMVKPAVQGGEKTQLVSIGHVPY